MYYSSLISSCYFTLFTERVADRPGYIVAGLSNSMEQLISLPRNFVQCVETEGSLPHSQEIATSPYSEPDQFIPLSYSIS